MSRSPIRVLHAGMSSNYGGVETFIMNLYRKIDRSKFQFSFHNGCVSKNLAFYDEIIELGGCVYPPMSPQRFGRYFDYHKDLKNFFDKYADEIDLIHYHKQDLVNIDILKYAKRYNIPAILHLHNTKIEKVNSYCKALSYRIQSGINRLFYRNYVSDCIVCSQLVSDIYCKGKAFVLKNAIDVDQYRFNPQIRREVREELGLQDAFTAMFVGNLNYQKNPLFLLDVFKSVCNKKSDSQLVMIGVGGLENEVRQKINDLQLENNVRLLGVRHDVERLLQGADVFLFPSRFEGFGIALLEAQVAGLPCFTSKDVVPSEVDQTGLVRFLPLEEDVEVWSDAILEANLNERKDYGDVIRAKGYDVNDNVRILEEKYWSLTRK